MLQSFEVRETAKVFSHDTLRIKGDSINARVNVFRFRDADTDQIVCFAPSLGISGYGPEIAQAEEMLKFSLKEFFAYLIDLSNKKREAELNALGFKVDRMKRKEFSKSYVDEQGELKDFNIVDGKVEHLTLEAA